ncbi:glutamine--fructose-6-phosphate transaminase (isomerizing) [Methanococcoides methylutens]|uniref:Glutamine--fructose-6-phosphate aminotransferase [isomerizing] n=1 Tax=Methanococcoides methylutens MM1 TaxID=1434104 RepID=A0A0E3WYW9_METMT|nr:glutamine--fructose-6-phosphate transaminase (isomerizing) [Methanococcoides methylutens]AKB84539.1 Glucosamine--fructose-6-phosphate aminotransferase (isomerizing) [Methanococcoides methylutens MM1]
MCGIIGYVGSHEAAPIIIDCLKKLEYRGYDSAGITILDEKIETHKTVGKIKELEQILPENLKGNIGIGHTRWATHGVPSTINSHPHNSGDISVVHNGIIENYLSIKEKLQQEGYNFLSDTDTEVIAHLMHSKLYGNVDSDEKICSFFDALQSTLQEVEGSYAITTVCGTEPDLMLAARKDSPLIMGLGESEYYAASDVTAFLNNTKDVVFVDDLNIVTIRPEGVEFFDIDGNVLEKEKTTIEWDIEAAEKAGYEHFMLKEINEQPRSVHDTFSGKLSELDGSVNLNELHLSNEEIRNIERIDIIACGTSLNAGLVGKYLFENLAGIHTDVDIGSEFRYSNPIMNEDILSIAITQSGETADTLAAIRSCRSYDCNTIAITNVVGSSITRDANSVLYTRAGPEIGVAATKTFTAQLTMLYILAIKFARAKGTMDINHAKDLLVNLKRIPGQIQKILNHRDEIRECAEMFAQEKDYFFVGRHLNYPIALEGALKLKEISYIHAEGFAGGELKHGPLALIEDGTPVVAIATKGHVYEKILSNIKEIKAREARVIAVANVDDTEIEKYVDWVLRVPATDELLSPLLSTVVLQLLAYYTALARGCSIDKPKNLAKSVTVE